MTEKINAVVFDADNTLIDFWPSTGKWMFREPNRREERGVKKLLKIIIKTNQFEQEGKI